MKFLEQITTLAKQAGLQTSKPEAGWMIKLSGSADGLIVQGRHTTSERGDWYRYLVFSATELVAVGTEQGNYAGGIDWRKSSEEPTPSLPVELQALLACTSHRGQERKMLESISSFTSVQVEQPQEGQDVEVLRRFDELRSDGSRYGVEVTQFHAGKFLCDAVNGPGRLRDLLPSGRVTHWRLTDVLDTSTQLVAAMEAKRVTDLLERD